MTENFSHTNQREKHLSKDKAALRGPLSPLDEVEIGLTRLENLPMHSSLCRYLEHERLLVQNQDILRVYYQRYIENSD